MDTNYENIVQNIKKDIATGLCKPDKKLPSVRELSIKYSCYKNTVVKAYSKQQLPIIVTSSEDVVKTGSFYFLSCSLK